MPEFRKRPVKIEAYHWLGLGSAYAPGWLVDALLDGTARQTDPGAPDSTIVISTLEGEMTAQLGDWIIQGVRGEIYSCKPDIFEAIYEPV